MGWVSAVVAINSAIEIAAAATSDDAHQRRLRPGASELRPVFGRKGRERDDGDRRVEDDDEADRAEEAAGEVATRAPNLLGEVGDRLEAGVGKHRQRQRERDR